MLLLKSSNVGALIKFTNVSEVAVRAKALDAHLREHKRQDFPAPAEEGT